MKKILIHVSFMVMTVITISYCADNNIDTLKVPEVVRQTFKTTFPKALDVKWEKEGKDYEAGFKQDTKTMSAVIDESGKLLETETNINVAELPKTVTDYLSTNYKGKKIKEAAMIKKASGEIVYEAEIGGKDVLFNEKGVFLKVAKD